MSQYPNPLLSHCCRLRNLQALPWSGHLNAGQGNKDACIIAQELCWSRIPEKLLSPVRWTRGSYGLRLQPSMVQEGLGSCTFLLIFIQRLHHNSQFRLKTTRSYGFGQLVFTSHLTDRKALSHARKGPAIFLEMLMSAEPEDLQSMALSQCRRQWAKRACLVQEIFCLSCPQAWIIWIIM